MKSAPVAFIALCLAGIFGGWYLRGQWDDRQINGLNTELNIAEKNLHIAEQRIAAAEQRIGVFPEYTTYSKLTNGELKEYTHYIIARLKQFDLEWQKATASALLPENQKNPKFFDELNEKFSIEYKTSYASECTNLLSEYFRRIPEDKRPEQSILGLPLVTTGIMIGHDPAGQVSEYLTRLANTLSE